MIPETGDGYIYAAVCPTPQCPHIGALVVESSNNWFTVKCVSCGCLYQCDTLDTEEANHWTQFAIEHRLPDGEVVQGVEVLTGEHNRILRLLYVPTKIGTRIPIGYILSEICRPAEGPYIEELVDFFMHVDTYQVIRQLASFLGYSDQEEKQ